jgi:single-strand DNA-binding protein
LTTRKWQDQSGADRYSTEIVLQGFNGNLTMLDGPGGGGGGSASFDEDPGSNYGGGSSRPQQRPQPAAFDTDLDDDVPF